MTTQIAITGPESTGKSTLAQDLAIHFKAPFLKEYAREYIASLDRKYTYEDVLIIAERMIEERHKILDIRNQKSEVRSQKKNRNSQITNNWQLSTDNSPTSDFLFFDTELINIKIWLEFYEWNVPSWITENIIKNPFDLYLLMDIDLPWISDEQRANPNDRAFLFQKFEDELKKIKANYVIINGTENERFKNAITAIKDYSRRV